MSKKKEVKFRHNVIVKVSKLLLKPGIKRNYGYKFKTYKELKNEGPFIVLGNHTVPIDPILMGMSFPFHLYYFATEQIFNLGFLSKLLIYAVNPIRKAKSISDMSSIRKAKQIVNEGASVAIYLYRRLQIANKKTYNRIQKHKLMDSIRLKNLFIFGQILLHLSFLATIGIKAIEGPDSITLLMMIPILMNYPIIYLNRVLSKGLLTKEEKEILNID